MNSGEYTQFRKNRALFVFNKNNKPTGNTTYDVVIGQKLGGSQVIVNSRVVEPSCCAPCIPPPVCISQDLVLRALQPMFDTFMVSNASPPQVTRIFYLFFMSVMTAWNWIQNGPLTGSKDSWSWNTRYILPAELHDAWMTQALSEITPVILNMIPVPMGVTRPVFDPAALSSLERSLHGSSVATQDAEHAAAHAQGDFTEWRSEWTMWLATRSADGSATANGPAVGELFPNGATYLTVDISHQNIAGFAHPTQWTPLTFTYNGSTKNQSYAGMHWDNVLSTVTLTESAFDATCDPLNPTTMARADEVVLVKNILTTADLTENDRRKVVAEFWAQGPGTISPPGFSIWLWKDYMETFRPDVQTFFYSGIDMAISQFEVARITWREKLRFVQARPIQEIRRLYSGPIVSWNGTIDASLWIPFQEPSFVTPPFPDVPSGHSAFAQICANVMTKWFGANIPAGGVRTRSNMKWLAPSMPDTQTAAFGVYVFPATSSKIQATVPTNPVTLTYTTWQETADASGVSRQYGGVHCISAHTMSVAIANQLSPILDSQWNLYNLRQQI